MDSKKSLSNEIDLLKKLIESLVNVGVLVYGAQDLPQSKSNICSKINQIVEQLSSLNTNLLNGDFPIPIDIISYIENGRNPEIYTREFVETTARTNALVKGKMLGFGKLQEVLSSNICSSFPHLENIVKSMTLRIVKS